MANYNLVGNPFTYNINWATDVKLTGVNDGYAVVKEDGGYEYRTGGVIKVGEGFMVNSAKGRSHNITFQKNINSVKRDSDNHINIEACLPAISIVRAGSTSPLTQDLKQM
mgnify:CR=1 FL=1